jgi:hypothetical protein
MEAECIWYKDMQDSREVTGLLMYQLLSWSLEEQVLKCYIDGQKNKYSVLKYSLLLNFFNSLLAIRITLDSIS